MSKHKNNVEKSSDVIHYDEYMAKGIPNALLVGLGLDLDEEQRAEALSEVEDNIPTAVDDEEDEAADVIICETEPGVVVSRSSDPSQDASTSHNPVLEPLARKSNSDDHSRENNYNSPVVNKRSGLMLENSSSPVQVGLGNTVEDILSSQLESIAGNVSDAEKQQLLRQCLLLATNTFPKQVPINSVISPNKINHKKKIHERSPNGQLNAGVIKKTSSTNVLSKPLDPDCEFPIDEHNIGEVLENSIKSTQAIRYTLSRLKEELRQVGVTSQSSNLILTKEQHRKKHEVAEKLQKAYDNYKQSVRRNIEQSRSRKNKTPRKNNLSAFEADEVIELSEDSDGVET